MLRWINLKYSTLILLKEVTRNYEGVTRIMIGSPKEQKYSEFELKGEKGIKSF